MVSKQVKAFLAQKRLAVVGVSEDPSDFSRKLMRKLMRRGYDIVPVNPYASAIEGLRCYRRIREIERPVQAVLLFTEPEVADLAVCECAQMGIKHVWLIRGVDRMSADAIHLCQINGINAVMGYSPIALLSKQQEVAVARV